MDVKKAAAETKDYIVSIRREFHRHPELSLQEFRTAQRIEEELDKFGIPHTRVGETGVLGTLKGAKDNGKCWFCVRISTRCPLRRRTSASIAQRMQASCTPAAMMRTLPAFWVPRKSCRRTEMRSAERSVLCFSRERKSEKVQSRLSQPVCWMVPSACSVCTPRMIWRQAR